MQVCVRQCTEAVTLLRKVLCQVGIRVKGQRCTNNDVVTRTLSSPVLPPGVWNAMTANDDFTSALRSSPKREIQDAVSIHTFNSAEKRSHSKMEEAAHLLCSDHRSLLADAARLKRRRRDGLERNSIVEPDRVVHSLSDNAFFETVSEECRRKCISKFIDATGSKALATASCAICTGTFFTSNFETMLLSDLQKRIDWRLRNPILHRY